MADTSGLDLIDAVPSSRQIRWAYDLWSFCYDKVAAPWEHGPRLRGLELAGLRPGERVLDVGVGTGAIALKMLSQLGQTGRIWGIDLSLRMLGKARRKLSAAGYSITNLLGADAIALPFRDSAFQVVYSAYVLDLLRLADIQLALAEFHRVLEPRGRLVLVNMSKVNPHGIGWIERVYRAVPKSWAACLLGGCRPVLLEGLVHQAGYCNIGREFVQDLISSEILFAIRP
jgi:demethylmenaquinone methyltransferase/2-methoxy-6-polyprenyl-1,4-benzoquinol methylase